jgi:hypothetical protein
LICWYFQSVCVIEASPLTLKQFPNTESSDRDQEVEQWQHISLQVPWFSNEELAIKDPGPLPNYSIGEEISASSPTSIAWSAPGLAQHNRCALAVLTSNLVLSIWSAKGKQQEESSWSRNLIINDALRTHFSDSHSSAEPSQITSDSVETERLRTRIRAFTWAPTFPESPKTLGTRISYGRHIVAVSNDDNQLAFVAIDSPTSSLGIQQSWTSQVLACCSLKSDNTTVFSNPSFFDDLMHQQRFVSHIAWSPWIVWGDSYRSVVAYATNKDVRTRFVTYTHDNIELGDEVLHSNIELRHKGPMKWCPEVGDDGKLTLALFTSTGLVCVDVFPNDASFVHRGAHDLDGRWDQTSGAIWDCGLNAAPRLHFTSMVSTLQSPTAAVELRSSGLEVFGTPSWRDRIENSLVLFSVKNDLKGNSRAKVWGLTSSPLGDFIATCHSAHPSDMIEYGPPAERRGTVAISALRPYGTIRQNFPAKSVSAEGVLFTLRKLVENTVEDSEHIPAFAEEITGKLLRAYGPVQELCKDKESSTTLFSSTDLRTLVKNVKSAAFLGEHILRDRYTILVSRACNDTSSNDLTRTLIAYRIANFVQSLPSSLPKLPFSSEVLAQLKEVANLISTIIGESDTDFDTSATIVNDWVDSCDFCSAPIPLTDLATAMCTNGHQFPRCGLSFLAIQAPGITKYCGICSTPFLSDEFVDAQEMDSERKDAETNDAGEVHGQDDSMQVSTADVIMIENSDVAGRRDAPPITLARVLFLACDVCVYCGGKFVS